MHFLLIVFAGDQDPRSGTAEQELRQDPRVLEVVSGNGGEDALGRIQECLTCGSHTEQRLAALHSIRQRKPPDMGYLTQADFRAFCPGFTTPEGADEIFEKLFTSAGPNGSQRLVVKGKRIQIRSFVQYVFQTDILPNGSDALLTELARMLC